MVLGVFAGPWQTLIELCNLDMKNFILDPKNCIWRRVRVSLGTWDRPPIALDPNCTICRWGAQYQGFGPFFFFSSDHPDVQRVLLK